MSTRTFRAIVLVCVVILAVTVIVALTAPTAH